MASAKFWLDGGYDRDLVEACRLHPNHGWITLRLGDIFVPVPIQATPEQIEAMKAEIEQAEKKLAEAKAELDALAPTQAEEKTSDEDSEAAQESSTP